LKGGGGVTDADGAISCASLQSMQANLAPGLYECDLPQRSSVEIMKQCSRKGHFD